MNKEQYWWKGQSEAEAEEGAKEALRQYAEFMAEFSTVLEMHDKLKKAAQDAVKPLGHSLAHAGVLATYRAASTYPGWDSKTLEILANRFPEVNTAKVERSRAASVAVKWAGGE